MPEVTRRRTGEFLRVLFPILMDHPDGMRARDALAALRSKVTLSEYEFGEYASGGQRINKIVRFATVDCVKAGWLVKQKGYWIVTAEGKKAFETHSDPEAFYKLRGRALSRMEGLKDRKPNPASRVRSTIRPILRLPRPRRSPTKKRMNKHGARSSSSCGRSTRTSSRISSPRSCAQWGITSRGSPRPEKTAESIFSPPGRSAVLPAANQGSSQAPAAERDRRWAPFVPVAAGR